MVTNQKKFCQFTDRDEILTGEAFDDEKRLVLLRGESFLVSRSFAESLEFSKLKSKLSECLIVYGRSFGRWFRTARAYR